MFAVGGAGHSGMDCLWSGSVVGRGRGRNRESGRFAVSQRRVGQCRSAWSASVGQRPVYRAGRLRDGEGSRFLRVRRKIYGGFLAPRAI